MAIHDLPPGDRLPALQAAAHDGVAAGEFTTHIAERSRGPGAGDRNGQPAPFSARSLRHARADAVRIPRLHETAM
jgi:hypothetical protein